MTSKLKDKFEDFGSIPNPEVWEGIEAALGQKRRKRRLLWIFLPAIAGLVALLFLLIRPETKNASKNEELAEHKAPVVRETNRSKENEIEERSLQGGAQNQDKVSRGVRSYTSTVILKKSPQNQERPFSLTEQNPASRDSLDKKEIQTASLEPQNPEAGKNDSLTSVTDAAIADSLKPDDSSLSAKGPQGLPFIEQDLLLRNAGWSLSLQAGTWDAFNNRNQLISYPAPESLLDGNSVTAGSFVQPQPQSPQSAMNTDTVSVLKPLSLRINGTYATSKNWTWTAGLNTDRMISRYNQQESRFWSVGMNLGFGQKFPLAKGFYLQPAFLLSYDRFLPGNKKMSPVTTASFATGQLKGQQFSLQLEMQLGVKLSEKQSIYLAPATRYYLHQSLTAANAPVLKRDFWNGLHLGWKYNF